MFNKDFYPTPSYVIEQMLMGVDIQNKIILEPSAGKGNIVDYLQENGAKEVLACEINNDLAKIVSSKCRFIDNDFLNLRSEDISHVDMIVMNPPFSADDKHIIHAWNIAPEGCEIISLCNAETIRNRYTQSRTELGEMIELNGRSEYFYDCFSDAERQTNVNVSCVYLFKPKTGQDEFEDFFSLDEDIDQGEDGITQYNYARDIVGRYVQAVRMFDNVMDVSDKINSITKPISDYAIRFGAYKPGTNNYNNTDITRDVFKKDLQKRAWHKVFNDMKMDKYITRGVKENINSFVEKQEHVPFTVKNVYKMVEIIVGTHGSRMNQVLIEAFDLICSFSSENSTAGEKWKTNRDYMVNKRFIVPYICDYDTRWPSNYVKIGYGRNRENIDDVIRALCFLTGTNYDSIRSLYTFAGDIHNIGGYNSRDHIGMTWGQWHLWEPFFKIRGYKKGTMHFEFANEDIWMKFNIAVSKAKGWQLPKQRATKTYNPKKAAPCDK